MVTLQGALQLHQKGHMQSIVDTKPTILNQHTTHQLQNQAYHITYNIRIAKTWIIVLDQHDGTIGEKNCLSFLIS